MSREAGERAGPKVLVFDLGPQLSIWFTDPDGMEIEVCWNRDASLRGFHAPAAIAEVTR